MSQATETSTNTESSKSGPGGVLGFLEDRLQIGKLFYSFHQRTVPGGPSIWLTTGPVALWMFILVGLTGVLMMSLYSPSMLTAWASVHHVEHTPGGSFIRGFHYWGSHALIILMAIHVFRMLLDASFRPKLELAWVLLIVMVPLLATAAVTGNPLSASNKAVAQIDVEARIIGSAPGAGPMLRELLLGGDRVGHVTMTHLYTLHVAVLPMIGLLLIGLYIFQFHVHQRNLAANENGVPYWPYQSAWNVGVIAVVVGIVAYLAAAYGAPLEAPYDPTIEEMPRPEWYAVFLFELRHYVNPEFLATIVLPHVLLGILVLVPAFDYFLGQSASRVFRIALVALLLIGWAIPTAMSYMHDAKDEKFLAVKEEGHMLAERASYLATELGVPPTGPATLLATDPMVQGPKLFKQYCNACHPYLDGEGHGFASELGSAPNLFGFGGRDWLGKLLDPEKITDKGMFGCNEALANGEMTSYVTDPDQMASELEPGQIEAVVAALSSVAGLPLEKEANSEEIVGTGMELLSSMWDEDGACYACHKVDYGYPAIVFSSDEDFPRYASRDWMLELIKNPNQANYYEHMDGVEGAMPGFADQLSEDEILYIVDWIRNDYLDAEAYSLPAVEEASDEAAVDAGDSEEADATEEAEATDGGEGETPTGGQEAAAEESSEAEE